MTPDELREKAALPKHLHLVPSPKVQHADGTGPSIMLSEGEWEQIRNSGHELQKPVTASRAGHETRRRRN